MPLPVQEAEPGSRAHGYVTGVQDYGVFVAFCNGVKGLAPASQLGLEAGQEAAKNFAIGKVRRSIFFPVTVALWRAVKGPT